MDRGIITGGIAMAAIVAAANFLLPIRVGNWLTLGGIVYPLTFLVTDLMNRLCGIRAARQVVYTGFAVGIACCLIGSQIIGADGPLVTLRITVASGTAYLVAQLVDVMVFDELRAGHWWRAPLVSSIFGSTLDTAFFCAIAFSTGFGFLGSVENVAWANESVALLGSGPAAPLWVSLGLVDWALKICVAMAVLAPFRFLVLRLSHSAFA